VPPRLIVLKSRQVGVSTLIEAILFHACLTCANRSALVLAHNLKSSRVLFRMSRTFYRMLAAEIQPERKLATVHEMEFGNGSRMQVEVQGDPRGYVAQYVHLSEFAMYDQPEETLVAVMQTVPMQVDSLVVIESTAKGVGNKFHRTWTRATGLALDKDVPLEEKGWTPVFVAWFDHEEYQRHRGPGKLTTDEVRLADRFGLTGEQLGWRRWCINSNLDGDEEKFGQEYPACLTAEVRVSTEKGILPISESLAATETESGPIVAGGPQPTSPIFLLTTAAGRVLRGTHDHPIHTPDGFVWLSRLKPGQEITLRPPRFAATPYTQRWSEIPGNETSVRIGRDWARLLGYFMGDGSWYAGTLSVVCDAKDQDVVEDVCRLVRNLIGQPTTRNIARVQGRKGAIEVRLGCVAARPTLARLGVVGSHAGHDMYRRNIHVPEAIWRSPRYIVREFLRGLFEADGSARGHDVTWSSSKIAFAREVQLLVLGFGIPTSLRASTKKSGSGNPYYSYALNFTKSASEAFHEHIGFVGVRKRSMRPAAPSAVGRPRFPMTLTDHVGSVRPDGHEATYDLTVEPDHEFSANGILTHNTPQEAFLLSGRPAFDTEAVLHYTEKVAESVRKNTLAARSEIESDPPGVGVPTIIVHDRGRLRIFAEPLDRHSYVIGADPSEGDPGSDASPLAVLDQMTLDLVATWYGRTPPDLLACHAVDLAKHFRDALIINEANNHGILFHETVISLGYPNLYYRKVSEDTVSGEVTQKPGYLSTQRNREHLFNTLRKFVRMRMGKLPCPHLVQQMQSLVYVDGKADAQSGAEKDLLIAFALCLMAHRGSMKAPLEPLPEETVRATAEDLRMLMERDPANANRVSIDRTGLSCEEVLAMEDQVLAQEQRQRRLGLGGMR